MVPMTDLYDLGLLLSGILVCCGPTEKALVNPIASLSPQPEILNPQPQSLNPGPET